MSWMFQVLEMTCAALAVLSDDEYVLPVMMMSMCYL